MNLFEKYKSDTIGDLFLDSDVRSKITEAFGGAVKPRVIFINGGVGCGKSVLARLIAREYYPTLSVNEVVLFGNNEEIDTNKGVVILDECDHIPSSVQEKIANTIKSTDNVYILISSNIKYADNLLGVADSCIFIKLLDYELLHDGLCKICDKESIPYSKYGIDCIIGKYGVNVRAMLADIQYIHGLGKPITVEGISEVEL